MYNFIIIVSYFIGREARVRQGLLIAAQIAIVHVIAAIIIVWLADVVLKAGFLKSDLKNSSKGLKR